MTGYRVEITKVDNGFTIKIDNMNTIIKVFYTIKEVSEFIEGYFPEFIKEYSLKK